MMKRMISALAMFAVVALSVQAYAAPKGGEAALADKPGQNSRTALTADQQAKAQQVVEQHRPKLIELREKIWAKNTELQALTAAGKAEKADIQSLVAEISALRTAMITERTAMGDELRKATGLTGFGPGFGSGCGNGDGAGYGQHSGRGSGYGMMGGPGAGRGMGGGQGRGFGGCGY